MIHGIYQKSRPKGKWHLISVAVSVEAATYDKDQLTKKAQLEGNDQIEIAIQIFDSTFHIPEFLSQIKEQKLMYN